MTAPAVVWAGPRRAVVRSGEAVARLELRDGMPEWCEVHRIGTGGPLLASSRNGVWGGTPHAACVAMAEAAAETIGTDPGALAVNGEARKP